MDDEPAVPESAHRHGISLKDCLRAYANALYAAARSGLDGEAAILIGPSSSGAVMLEIGVTDRNGVTSIIHATKARSEFLVGGGDR